MSSTVKVFHWLQSGAPSLTSAAGSAIALMDAVLINGYNSKSVTSLVVASSVATATLAVGHGFKENDVVYISGATPTALNGEKVINTVTRTTFKFSASGVTNQTATGTITSKFSSLGWSATTVGTNVKMYRSTSTFATKKYLKVFDTTTEYLRVHGLDTYDATTFESYGMFPNRETAQSYGNVGLLYWPKCVTGQTSSPWMIVGDDRSFYYWTKADPSIGSLYFFGDFTPTLRHSSGNCLIVGEANNPINQFFWSDIVWLRGDVDEQSRCAYVARCADGIVSKPVAFSQTHMDCRPGAGGSGASSISLFTQSSNYPQTGLIGLHEVGSLIGFLPGAITVGANVFDMYTLDTFTHARVNGGARTMAIQTQNGVLFMDIAGPWDY